MNVSSGFLIGQPIRVKKGVKPYGGKRGTVVEEYSPQSHLGPAVYEVKLGIAFSVPHTKLYKADEIEAVNS